MNEETKPDCPVELELEPELRQALEEVAREEGCPVDEFMRSITADAASEYRDAQRIERTKMCLEFAKLPSKCVWGLPVL